MSTNWGSNRTVIALIKTVLLSSALGDPGESLPMSTTRAQGGLWILVTEQGSPQLLQKGLQHSAAVPAAIISLAVAQVQH